MNKKKLIFYSVLFFICLIGLIISMVLSSRMKDKTSDNITTEQSSGSNTEQQQDNNTDLVIDGIGNLYFIPTSDHGRFSEELSNYLTNNNIIPLGTVTQVGDVVADEQGKFFMFYLHMKTETQEVYLKGVYSLDERTYVYVPEDDLNNIPRTHNVVDIGVDEQEAPETEFADIPVNVSGLENLNEMLTTEQIIRLESELQSFLSNNNELRRELLIDETSIKMKDGKVTFTCVFVSERHDKKNVKVEYEDDKGFTLKLN